eukprot:TRINITY_DN1436_c1_g1_i1.p2 TRINITY_DN1436_c1_g1~~TRINITY_DN1436_c1_g1_i1.p2  ORF type:complete len:125 (+),score=16.00 TRINITY_DN1436_c1_g1_i1:667-1041(+)
MGASLHPKAVTWHSLAASGISFNGSKCMLEKEKNWKLDIRRAEVLLKEVKTSRLPLGSLFEERPTGCLIEATRELLKEKEAAQTKDGKRIPVPQAVPLIGDKVVHLLRLSMLSSARIPHSSTRN